MSAPAAAPARNSGILECFANLDQLLKNAVTRARRLYHSGEGEEAFHGLYISEQEIDALVGRTGTIGSVESDAVFLEHCASLPGIEGLSAYWRLSPFDHAAMLLALAPEVDLRYERIYAYLQDDVTRRKPTVELALNLFSAGAVDRIANRAHFSPGAPLIESGLLRLTPDPSHVEPPLPAHYLQLDPSAIRLLLGDSEPDHRLAAFCEIEREVAVPRATSDILSRIPRFLAAVHKQGNAVRMLFSGQSAASTHEAARAVAASEKLPLLSADLARSTPWRSEPAVVASLLLGEAARMGAVLHLHGLDPAPDASVLGTFFDAILSYNGFVTVASDSPVVAAALAGACFLSVPFPLPDYEARRALWEEKTEAAGIEADPSTLSTLANHFAHGAE